LNKVFLLTGLSLATSAWGQVALTEFRVAFYNVENLFDTIDHPQTLDDAFTPTGEKAWTTTRYRRKLNQIAQVMDSLQLPAIIGLAEVENRAVLEDLVQTKALRPGSYAAVSYDSPDLRGIDVGLLYRQDHFRVDSAGLIRIAFPLWLEPEGYTTRDILYVRLDGGAHHLFHCFVVHWPSRRGGELASEHRRLWVAQYLRRALDGLLAVDTVAQVLIMGDFNDKPDSRSVHNVLGAIEARDTTYLPGVFYNHMMALQRAGEGSYNYRGEWNMLDQFVTHGIGWPGAWRVQEVRVYRPDWLLYEGKRPNRTYGGPKYYGGFSDHLPIVLDLVWQSD